MDSEDIEITKCEYAMNEMTPQQFICELVKKTIIVEDGIEDITMNFIEMVNSILRLQRRERVK